MELSRQLRGGGLWARLLARDPVGPCTNATPHACAVTVPRAVRAICALLTILPLSASGRVVTMQDDLTRAERYGTLAASMLRTAELEADKERRAGLLSIANQYAFLAVNLLNRRAALDFP